MNNLTIINNNGQLVTDSREVATMIGRAHKEIIAMIEGQKHENGRTKHIGLLPTISESGLFSPQDFFIKSSYKSEGNNKSYPYYLLTKKGCDMVANKMTGEKGVLFTAAYVTRFEDMETQLRTPSICVPKTYAEALRELATSVEEKERLEQQNLIMEPKAQYFDRLVSVEHLTNFRNTAHELGIKERKFITWLENKAYIYRNARKKIKAYGEYIPDLFNEKDFATTACFSGVLVMITVKGKNTFREQLQLEGLI